MCRILSDKIGEQNSQVCGYVTFTYTESAHKRSDEICSKCLPSRKTHARNPPLDILVRVSARSYQTSGPTSSALCLQPINNKGHLGLC